MKMAIGDFTVSSFHRRRYVVRVSLSPLQKNLSHTICMTFPFLPQNSRSSNIFFWNVFIKIVIYTDLPHSFYEGPSIFIFFWNAFIKIVIYTDLPHSFYEGPSIFPISGISRSLALYCYISDSVLWRAHSPCFYSLFLFGLWVQYTKVVYTNMWW